MTRRRVLFVCTHNSARSQMAEAYLQALAGDRFAVESAGTDARGVHPMAIQAMAEDGIDISLQKSKSIDQFIDQRFDVVITVCDDAAEACPVFPHAGERRHWSFRDPSAVIGDEEHRFKAFASVRDEIRQRIEDELIAEVVA